MTPCCRALADIPPRCTAQTEQNAFHCCADLDAGSHKLLVRFLILFSRHGFPEFFGRQRRHELEGLVDLAGLPPSSIEHPTAIQ